MGAGSLCHAATAFGLTPQVAAQPLDTVIDSMAKHPRTVADMNFVATLLGNSTRTAAATSYLWARVVRAVVRVATAGFNPSRAEVYNALDGVEIDQTFHRVPPPGLARRWREEAPDGFVIAVKASQRITHGGHSRTYSRAPLPAEIPPDGVGGFQETKWVDEATDATLETARAAEADWIVFQSPPTFGPEAENVRAVGRYFGRHPWPCRIAWEPRGEWAPDTLDRIARIAGVVIALDPFARPPVGTGEYMRVHGSPPGPRLFRYSYSDEDLRKVEAWTRTGDPLVVFNNVTMFEDAARFRALARGKAVGSRRR